MDSEINESMAGMIHLALVIVAFIVICYAVMLLLSLAVSGFHVNKGCGCFTLILAGGIALAIIMYAC